MPINVTRRTMSVEVILDQEKAERIVELGRELTAANNSRVKVEGGNPQAKKIAERIERLRAEAEEETLHLTLRALPYSKWERVLAGNKAAGGNGRSQQYELVGVVSDSVALMAEEASVGGEPLPEQDLTPTALREAFGQMTDGQITPLVEAVYELNTRRADPKAAFDLASRTLDSSRS